MRARMYLSVTESGGMHACAFAFLPARHREWRPQTDGMHMVACGLDVFDKLLQPFGVVARVWVDNMLACLERRVEQPPFQSELRLTRLESGSLRARVRVRVRVRIPVRVRLNGES